MRSSIFERQFFGQTLKTSSNLGGLNPTSYLDSRYSLGQQPYTSDEELAKAEKAYSDISKTGSKSEVEKAYAKYKDAYEKVLEELADRAKLEKLAEEQNSDVMGDDPKGFNKRLKDRAGQMEKIWPGWYDSHLAWKIYESTGGQPKWYRDMLDAGATAANIALQLFLLKQQSGVNFKRPSIPTGGRPATPSVPKPAVPYVPTLPPVRPPVPTVVVPPTWVKPPPGYPKEHAVRWWVHPQTKEMYMEKSVAEGWLRSQQKPPVITPSSPTGGRPPVITPSASKGYAPAGDAIRPPSREYPTPTLPTKVRESWPGWSSPFEKLPPLIPRGYDHLLKDEFKYIHDIPYTPTPPPPEGPPLWKFGPAPQSKVVEPDRPSVATCDTSKGQFYDPQTGQCRGSISTFPGGMPGDFGGAASMPTSSYASQFSSMTSMGRAGFLPQVPIAQKRQGF